ncbi:MAG: cytoskeleton protein RodZ [Solirubrobacterales bacterium]|jgi:transcriptional regulator with XRE-family HTH domain|nr:cytoskeleton protein RodZ [Solirubrobacterales bacterium]
MSGERPGEIPIGETLAAARARAGLEIEAVAERTKIRARYLSALEAERWDELPSRAYGKGFLRTYAELLGLDAETLVDEYRRQVEAGAEPSLHPLGDAVLEGRRRRPQASEGPRIALLLGLAGAIVIGAVLVIALVGSGNDEKPAGNGPDDEPHGGKRDAVKPQGTVELAMAIHAPVEVCLVGGGGEALIDGQVLAAGDREHFERQRFQLRFPKGFDPKQLTLKLGGEERRLPKAAGPAAYEIVAPRHVALAAQTPKESCP